MVPCQLRWWLGLLCLSCVLTLAQVRDMGLYTAPHHVLHEMNDIPNVVLASKDAPTGLGYLVASFLGRQQQVDVQVYRPIGSTLEYFDLQLGLRYGWFVVGVVGVVLHLLNCGLATALAWRVTGSRVAMVASAVFSALAPWIGEYSPEWPVWFPMHAEILQMSFVLGVLLLLDLWLERGTPQLLASVLICFSLGLFAKEYVIIVTPMALALAVTHPQYALRRKAVWGVLGYMVLATVCFLLLRHSLLTAPRNPPPLKWSQFYLGQKIFFWMAHPFYLYVPPPGYNFWFPGLAVLLLGLGSAVLRGVRRWPAAALSRRGLFIVALGPPLTVLAYLQFCTPEGSWADAAQWIVQSQIHFLHLVYMMGTAYSYYLLCKYRKTSRSLTVVALLALAYVPVFTMDGWHYGVPGAVMRGALFWPVVFELWVRDTGLLKTRPLRRFNTALSCR